MTGVQTCALPIWLSVMGYTYVSTVLADYEFKNGEKGLYYRCLGRTGRIVFAKGYATYCLKQGWMYRQKMEYIAIEEHIPNKGDKKTFKK